MPKPRLSNSRPLARRSWRRFLAVVGPGIVVMLADTDAGSIITAAQSGAQWGFQLLLLQFILVPILYIAQELTLRLGIVTRKGHAELIRDYFGRGCAWFSVAILLVTCIGALLSELSGLAGVGLLMGVPIPVTMSLIVIALIVMVYRGSYLSVERIAIAAGAFELVFLFVAWQANLKLRRSCFRICRYCVARTKIPLPCCCQYRYGDHAVDALLPAVIRCGEKSIA